MGWLLLGGDDQGVMYQVPQCLLLFGCSGLPGFPLRANGCLGSTGRRHDLLGLPQLVAKASGTTGSEPRQIARWLCNREGRIW